MSVSGNIPTKREKTRAVAAVRQGAPEPYPWGRTVEAAGREPAGPGPDGAGRVRVPLSGKSRPVAAPPCAPVARSHRVIAPTRLIAGFGAR
ncbi:hypothetical protein ABZT03_36585 [Streptomyces sp. NPDC005574]|uniref:hypothetical protein n=1 Tax=Streptomyces sp. NPDC005574 TaxID=3156891 RepID=UPI0033A32B23